MYIKKVGIEIEGIWYEIKTGSSDYRYPEIFPEDVMSDLPDMMSRINNVYKKPIIESSSGEFKRDGSVSSMSSPTVFLTRAFDVEINSIPLDPKPAVLAGWILKYYPIMFNKSCGTHVHCSFLNSTIYGFLMENSFIEYFSDKMAKLLKIIKSIKKMNLQDAISSGYLSNSTIEGLEYLKKTVDKSVPLDYIQRVIEMTEGKYLQNPLPSCWISYRPEISALILFRHYINIMKLSNMQIPDIMENRINEIKEKKAIPFASIFDFSLFNDIDIALFEERIRGGNKYCKKTFFPRHQSIPWNKTTYRYSQLNYAYNKFKTIECRVFPVFSTAAGAYIAIQYLLDAYNEYITSCKEDVLTYQYKATNERTKIDKKILIT